MLGANTLLSDDLKLEKKSILNHSFSNKVDIPSNASGVELNSGNIDIDIYTDQPQW